MPDPPNLTAELDDVKKAREAYQARGDETNRLALASSLGGAAFAAVFEKRYADAVDWSQEALALIEGASQAADSKRKAGLVFIYGNLAHALLFQGKYDEALAIYAAHWEKPLQNRKFKDAVLEDFAMFAQAGLTHPDIARIKKHFGVEDDAPPPQRKDG